MLRDIRSQKPPALRKDTEFSCHDGCLGLKEEPAQPIGVKDIIELLAAAKRQELGVLFSPAQAKIGAGFMDEKEWLTITNEKPTKAADVALALKSAMAHNLGFVLPQGVIKELDLSEILAGFQILTRRENEVLSLLLKNKKGEKISSELNISEGVVKFHISSILKKLSLRTAAEIKALFTVAEPVTVSEIISGSDRLNTARMALAPQEIKAAKLVSEGRNNNEIAAELGVVEEIPRTYLLTLSKKLGISGRGELIMWYRNYEQYLRAINQKPRAEEVISERVNDASSMAPQNLSR